MNPAQLVDKPKQRPTQIPRPLWTGRARDVDLIPPLAQDLAEWRMACGRPGDDELIIPRPSGGQWTREDWANWRRRVWRPAAIEAGRHTRPASVPSSRLSSRCCCGGQPGVRRRAGGHSIVTLARHYAGVLEELEDQPRIPAADAIRQAREEVCGTHSGRSPQMVDDRK